MPTLKKNLKSVTYFSNFKNQKRKSKYNPEKKNEENNMSMEINKIKNKKIEKSMKPKVGTLNISTKLTNLCVE